MSRFVYFLFCALIVGTAHTASASAVYSSQVAAEVKLVGIYDATTKQPITPGTGVTVFLSAGPHASNQTTALGSGIASNIGGPTFEAADPDNVQIGEGISVELSSTGSTDLPWGDSSASNRFDFHMSLNNTTAGNVLLEFLYDYSWDITKQATTIADSATVGYRFNFHTHDGTLSESLELQNLNAPSGTGSGSISFTGEWAPGEGDLHLIARSLGTAHTVPEPTTWTMIGTAVASLALCALRRRAIARGN